MRIRMRGLVAFIVPAAIFGAQLPETDRRHVIRHTDMHYKMPGSREPRSLEGACGVLAEAHSP